jgi:Fur family ferric uptake transcriptional regulator
MNRQEMKQLLKPFGLKLTLPRLKLLEIFSSYDKAITAVELLALTNRIFDKVTVYRTLKSFEDIGIIHRILGANSSPSFALSAHDVCSEKSAKQHLHFSCIKCNGVYCLDDLSVPSVILPAMYEIHSLNMLVVGICRCCNQSLTRQNRE